MLIRLATSTTLLYFLILSSCFAQEMKIDLREVEVTENALPVIEINTKDYSFRDRDYFVRLLLKSRFWQNNFQLKIALESFYNDRIFTYKMSGRTKVFIDDLEIKKNHPYKRKKVNRVLIDKVDKIRITESDGLRKIEIITNDKPTSTKGESCY